jgi:hypothetical protein
MGLSAGDGVAQSSAGAGARQGAWHGVDPQARGGAPVVSPRGDAGSLPGLWRNHDPNTGGITRVDLSQSGSAVQIRMWGRCHPADCDWGQPAAYDASRVAAGAR